MPELPDVELYVEALRDRVLEELLVTTRVRSAFLLRTFDPPLMDCHGKKVLDVRRLGKRIVFELEDEHFLVIHLMVAGRFKWSEEPAKIPGRVGLAAFDFSSGSLLLTEAGKKKRASLHVVRADSLEDHDRGGLEVFDASLEDFRERLLIENHTIKRTLTDPRLFSGIGNAYSDEILHRAQLSPLVWTTRLSDEQIVTLYRCCREVLREWTDLLREEAGGDFPKKVTAFRKEMAVHGKYREACPVCGDAVQRIVYAENECNYCAQCQTGGKLLADRALSRLLKKDWPRSVQELEELRGPAS